MSVYMYTYVCGYVLGTIHTHIDIHTFIQRDTYIYLYTYVYIYIYPYLFMREKERWGERKKARGGEREINRAGSNVAHANKKTALAAEQRHRKRYTCIYLYTSMSVFAFVSVSNSIPIYSYAWLYLWQNNAITRAALGIFKKLQSSSELGGREEEPLTTPP